MIKVKSRWLYARGVLCGFLGFMAVHSIRHYIRQNKVVHNYLIVADHDKSTTLVHLQETVAPLIDTIIQDVLALPAEQEDNPRFNLQKHQHLTLYYPTKYAVDEQQSLIDALDALVITPFNVTIDHDCAFFGDRADTLIMKIGDPEHALHALHDEIRSKLHRLNTRYKNEHKRDLYDMDTSERFAYIPHIGLGRIPVNDTRYFSGADGDGKLQVIKQRIEREVFPVIRLLLTVDNRKIRVDAIHVGDLSAQKKIFEKQF